MALCLPVSFFTTSFAGTKVCATSVPTQSDGLSRRLLQINADGRRLVDDSGFSEKVLTEAMVNVISHATELFKPIGFKIVHRKTITLHECQVFFEKAGGPKPNTENKKVFMKPDGGILFAVSETEEIPILIVEDKVQGTNDLLHAKGKKRQATGNAIERAAKNIRGAEMLFARSNLFPYVMFASGCDFHSSETIAKRIEMMNMGVPNHNFDSTVDQIIPAIKIQKLLGHGIASVFVKAHKWDTAAHGSSTWTKEERVQILKRVVDLMFESCSKRV